MSDFINSTVNTKIYNLMSDEHQIITITDKEAVVENIGTIVSGDTNSCLLTFEINRFQDGIDLSDKKIRFNYRNSNGKFYDIAVNVKYNDDVIRFSWLLPYSLTQPGGNVIASIEFYGFIEYDEEYSYKTKNFKLSVEKSLGVDEGSEESYNNWTIKIENDVEAIQKKIGEIEKDVKDIYVPTKLSEMDDDAEHRTVSDSQIGAWNEAHKNSQADWNEENTNSSAYIKNKPQIPTVTNDLTDELKQSYDNAVTNSHVHSNKSVIDDITAEKVDSWDNKSEFDGNYSSLQGIPEDIATETYVNEKIKNKVNDSDLATVAKTGSYNDLNDTPTSLPASDVYQWAKQSQKPTYTADEVGALPKDTEIPSKTSDLRNDSGFLKQPETAQIGQIFRVQSITEDGNLVLEAVDMPSGGSGGAVDDVQIDGKSVVGENGVANIPIANNTTPGVISPSSNYGTQVIGSTIAPLNLTTYVDNRQSAFMTYRNLDYGVKQAMCDGKGESWTADEQAAARERMGIGNFELIEEIVIEESIAGFTRNVEPDGTPYDFKGIYVYMYSPNTNGEHGGRFYFYCDNENLYSPIANFTTGNDYITLGICELIGLGLQIPFFTDMARSYTGSKLNASQIILQDKHINRIKYDIPVNDAVLMQGDIIKIYGMRW